MKKIFIASLVCAASLYAHPAHLHDGSEILSSMHTPMMENAFSQSGNVEHDFLANMIPHHQGAIDSSKLLLHFEIDEDLKKIAQNIIKTQEAEVKEFKNILANKAYTQTKLSQKEYLDFINAEKQGVETMMHAMHGSGEDLNVPKAYIQAMIAHHKGATMSAKNLLKYSKDTKIRAIANKIIQDQEKEILDFEELFKRSK